MSDNDLKIMQVCFSISPAQAELLNLFMSTSIVGAKDMISIGADPNNYRMSVYRLRNVLEKFGVDIESQQNLGYWLEADARAKVRELLDATAARLAPDGANAALRSQRPA